MLAGSDFGLECKRTKGKEDEMED